MLLFEVGILVRRLIATLIVGGGCIIKKIEIEKSKEGTVVLKDALLEKEIVSWDEKDLRFISAIVRGTGSEFGFKDAYIAKTLVKQYKHLGIFTKRFALNKKGIRIMQFLQNK